MAISFDPVADIYDQTRALPPAIADRVTAQILRFSHATADARFLEPGIGTGRIALPLVELGYAYTGVDVSQAMMAKLRQKLAGKTHRLRLVEANAVALPFGDWEFDVAIAAHILHLIPAWEQALGEIRRVLKPGGVFIYFHHPARRTAVTDPVGQQWQHILQHHGYSPDFPGAIPEDVIATLLGQGASLETVLVAEHTQVQSVGKRLQAYRDRIYSHLWQIPETLYPQALRELESWAAQTYPSADTALTSTYAIRLTAAYGWGGTRP